MVLLIFCAAFRIFDSLELLTCLFLSDAVQIYVLCLVNVLLKVRNPVRLRQREINIRHDILSQLSVVRGAIAM